jgi:hypothetical protein
MGRTTEHRLTVAAAFLFDQAYMYDYCSLQQMLRQANRSVQKPSTIQIAFSFVYFFLCRQMAAIILVEWNSAFRLRFIVTSLKLIPAYCHSSHSCWSLLCRRVSIHSILRSNQGSGDPIEYRLCKQLFHFHST